MPKRFGASYPGLGQLEDVLPNAVPGSAVVPYVLPSIDVTAPGPTILVPTVIDTVSFDGELTSAPMATPPIMAPTSKPWVLWALLAVGAYFLFNGGGRRRMDF